MNPLTHCTQCIDPVRSSDYSSAVRKHIASEYPVFMVLCACLSGCRRYVCASVGVGGHVLNVDPLLTIAKTLGMWHTVELSVTH